MSIGYADQVGKTGNFAGFSSHPRNTAGKSTHDSVYCSKLGCSGTNHGLVSWIRYSQGCTRAVGGRPCAPMLRKSSSAFRRGSEKGNPVSIPGKPRTRTGTSEPQQVESYESGQTHDRGRRARACPSDRADGSPYFRMRLPFASPGQERCGLKRRDRLSARVGG